MVGGTTSGYSLIGNRHSASKPRMKMMRESTPAKIGRRIKKWEKFILIRLVEGWLGNCDIHRVMAVTTEALRLPPEERLKLLEEIWNSFAAEPASLPVSAGEIEELERRRKHYVSNPDSLVDWRELKIRLQQRRKDAPN